MITRLVLALDNTRSDWFFSRNAHGPITGLQKQSKKPYNKQRIYLERSVLTGNLSLQGLRLRISLKDLTVG